MILRLRLLTVSLALILSMSSTQAASLQLCQCEKPDGAVAYGLYIDASGVGPTNTIRVGILPNSPLSSFLNYDADGILGSFPDWKILGPGSDYTFTNAQLTLPQALGGYGFTLVDAFPDGPAGIDYELGQLGGYIDTTKPIFLNNFVLPPGGLAFGSVRLSLTGSVVSTLNFIAPLLAPFPSCVPEPGTFAMAGMGLIGLVLRRRNG